LIPKNHEELTDYLFKIKEFGLRMVDFAYANNYADMGDMNDISEFKEELTKEFDELMRD